MTDAAVAGLMAARTGHFLLESGHHGELWLDLDGLFWSPSALRPLVEDLAERVRRRDPEVVCGPLVGGALLGQLVADRLDLPFVPSERVATADHGLYGTGYRLPVALAPRLAGRRVVVVDDVVNAGSAVRATTAAVDAAGGRVVALAALLVLGTTGRAWATELALPLDALAERPNRIWEPAACPRCSRGEALEPN